jgi:TolA-binding protein
MSRIPRPWFPTLGAGLALALALACGGSQRPEFTEAPAATVTVPLPVASQAPPAETGGSAEASNDLPLADDGIGGDVGTSPPAPAPIATTASGGGAPHAILPARDPRATRPARARALIVTETQGLTSLLATTAQAAPDRPLLVRRIAEDYAELERGTPSAGIDPLARAARTKAIDFYTQLEAFPAYPHLDEALYFKGLELEGGGDVTGARRAYFDLIRKAPQSKLVAFAYFAFGEMFFDEAVADPSKNDLALQAYREVLKVPANALFAESLLRSAQIAERKGDRTQARLLYKQVLQTHPGTSAALGVPAWARGP